MPSAPVTRRRRCRDSVDIQIEGAEATVDPMPTTSRGSGGAAATSGHALDAPLTSGKEIPAARIMYRLGQNIDIDFGPVNNNLGGQEYSLVSKKWLDNISKCISRCNKCNQKLVHKTDGFSFAATYITHCKNRFCNFDKDISNIPDKLGHFFYS